MSAKSATGILEHEHRYIQRVVGVMKLLAEALTTGKKVKAATLHDLVDFMRQFGDICHHGKEEACLFPALVKKGVPLHGCSINGLMHEHEAGRALVKQLAENIDGYAKGDRIATESLVNSLRSLTKLYPMHIWKEDYLLFPMTDKILSPEEQQALLKEFAVAEERFGEKTRHRFERLVKKLEQAAQTALDTQGEPQVPVQPEVPASVKPTTTESAKYECTECGYVYDPALGDPKGGIPPGTRFEDLPSTWRCPWCGVGKAFFRKLIS